MRISSMISAIAVGLILNVGVYGHSPAEIRSIPDATGAPQTGATTETAAPPEQLSHGSMSTPPTTPTVKRNAAPQDRLAITFPEYLGDSAIYVWCDPDGLWTVFWPKTISPDAHLRISSDLPLEVSMSAGADSHAESADDLLVLFSADGQQTAGIVQFRTLSGTVGFEAVASIATTAIPIRYGHAATRAAANSLVLPNIGARAVGPPELLMAPSHGVEWGRVRPTVIAPSADTLSLGVEGAGAHGHTLTNEGGEQ